MLTLKDPTLLKQLCYNDGRWQPADNGTTSSPFSTLGVSTTAYDMRVRSMVAMLMTQQRFQEQ